MILPWVAATDQRVEISTSERNRFGIEGFNSDGAAILIFRPIGLRTLVYGTAGSYSYSPIIPIPGTLIAKSDGI